MADRVPGNSERGSDGFFDLIAKNSLDIEKIDIAVYFGGDCVNMSTFEKWTPIENLCSSFDVDDIRWCEDGIIFSLSASTRNAESHCIHSVQLKWESSRIIAYHVTDETYRADCWGLDFKNEGRLYVSRVSGYLESLRQKSPLVPEDAYHFLIVGTDTIVDVIAKDYPQAKSIEEVLK